jgi:hypothetical protein
MRVPSELITCPSVRPLYRTRESLNSQRNCKEICSIFFVLVHWITFTNISPPECKIGSCAQLHACLWHLPVVYFGSYFSFFCLWAKYEVCNTTMWLAVELVQLIRKFYDVNHWDALRWHDMWYVPSFVKIGWGILIILWLLLQTCEMQECSYYCRKYSRTWL